MAKEDVLDEFSHPVSKGSPFLKCRYLERIDEKKGAVFYKSGGNSIRATISSLPAICHDIRKARHKLLPVYGFDKYDLTIF